jgi:hypothetical protein
MKPPRVSVITPTYNRAHLLPRAWNSLRRQTLADFQWIVVDDGSSDDTRAVVAGFADPRIRYVYQDNQGCNIARNRGEQEVEADFVTFLDSDDELYAADTLNMMLNTLSAARPEIGMAYFTVVDGEGRQGFHVMQGDEMETTYLDHLCRQKIRGEFMPIFRRETLALTPWPLYNGMEVLRHWRLLRHYQALVVRKPARIYHHKAGDNLTGAMSAIQRAGAMSEANLELIAEHRHAWLQHCPCELGRQLFYAAMYQALDGQTLNALKSAQAAFPVANWPIRKSILTLLVSLAVPAPLRKRLFLLRARGWGA